MAIVFNPFTSNLDYTGTGGGGGGGSASFKNPVPNQAALPLSGNSDGDVRVTLDTDTIWIWNAGTSSWISQKSYNVNTFLLTPTDITNKGVVLSQVPTAPSKVSLFIGGAPAQVYNLDYTIDSNLQPNCTLDWTGYSLDGILASGDNLIVMFY